jgi:hypothetical protein
MASFLSTKLVKNDSLKLPILQTRIPVEQARPKLAQCTVCAVLSTKLSKHFDSLINKLIRTCERNLVTFDFLCCLNNFVLYFGRACCRIGLHFFLV